MKDLSMYGDINKYPCSLVMSGVESDAYFDIAIGEGIDRMLMSYHYIQRKGKGFIRERLSKHPHVKLMIDSGAHTFHAKEEEFKNKPMKFWENYLERYTNFIKANKEFIFSCVELDIANLVGFEAVDYFRKKYFEPLKEHGILVCYVWHDYDGDKHWEEMCAKYDYVGFSLVNSSMGEKDIIRKMNIARRYGALVHGFAVTRVDIMSKVPFFTGDSTTWLVGTQYGELNWFDGRKMRRLKKDKWKFEYRQKYMKLGAKEIAFTEENPYELIRINLIVFLQAEEYIRKRIRGKSYWLVAPPPKPKLSLRIGKSSLRKTVISKSEEESVVAEKPKKKLLRKKKKVEHLNEVVAEDLQDSEVEIVAPTLTPAISKIEPTKFEKFQAEHAQEVQEVRELATQVKLLPSSEWFSSNMSDLENYLEDLGLSFALNDYARDEVLDNLYNMVIFLSEDYLLEDISDSDIEGIVKYYSKEPTDSREGNIEIITDLLTKNLTLELNTIFPKISGSMSMEATEKAIEREEYLEEENFEMVDISEEEMISYLPTPKEGEEGSDMPEVDELDAELSRHGIVAIRDEKGRFLKGQKRVRKPKNIYSEKFPKLACNTCYKAGDCPEFKPDHVCAYDKIFKNFDVRNTTDIMDAMSSMVNANLGRMQRQMMFETMDGGMADGVVTSMIDQNVNLLLKLKQLQDAVKTPQAIQHRVLNADGSMQETTTVTNPTGGILAQIFGAGNQSKEDKDIIDVEAEEL